MSLPRPLQQLLETCIEDNLWQETLQITSSILPNYPIPHTHVSLLYTLLVHPDTVYDHEVAIGCVRLLKDLLNWYGSSAFRNCFKFNTERSTKRKIVRKDVLLHTHSLYLDNDTDSSKYLGSESIFTLFSSLWDLWSFILAQAYEVRSDIARKWVLLGTMILDVVEHDWNYALDGKLDMTKTMLIKLLFTTPEQKSINAHKIMNHVLINIGQDRVMLENPYENLLVNPYLPVVKVEGSTPESPSTPASTAKMTEDWTLTQSSTFSVAEKANEMDEWGSYENFELRMRIIELVFRASQTPKLNVLDLTEIVNPLCSAISGLTLPAFTMFFSHLGNDSLLFRQGTQLAMCVSNVLVFRHSQAKGLMSAELKITLDSILHFLPAVAKSKRRLEIVRLEIAKLELTKAYITMTKNLSLILTKDEFRRLDKCFDERLEFIDSLKEEVDDSQAEIDISFQSSDESVTEEHLEEQTKQALYDTRKQYVTLKEICK